jgi:hypothetical protein
MKSIGAEVATFTRGRRGACCIAPHFTEGGAPGDRCEVAGWTEVVAALVIDAMRRGDDDRGRHQRATADLTVEAISGVGSGVEGDKPPATATAIVVAAPPTIRASDSGGRSESRGRPCSSRSSASSRSATIGCLLCSDFMGKRGTGSM